MLPSQYLPTEIHDFIGPARQQARFLTALVASTLPNKAPLKILLTGSPGVGKSALSLYLLRLLGANQWTTDRRNGARIGIEEMTEMAHAMRLREMYGNYRVFQWEEADRMSQAAQVAALTLLDDLPPGNAVIATTNKPIKEFEPRFQRRFKVFELPSPTAEEISAFLHDRFQVPQSQAANIARMAVLACGGVGQALQDADCALVTCQMAA